MMAKKSNKPIERDFLPYNDGVLHFKMKLMV